MDVDVLVAFFAIGVPFHRETVETHLRPTAPADRFRARCRHPDKSRRVVNPGEDDSAPDGVVGPAGQQLATDAFSAYLDALAKQPQ